MKYGGKIGTPKRDAMEAKLQKEIEDYYKKNKKIAISNHKPQKQYCRVLQNDIQYLADGGGSSPIQTKATIKMIKVFNTQPQRNFSSFRSAS